MSKVAHIFSVGVSGIIRNNSQVYSSIKSVKFQDFKTSRSSSMYFTRETIFFAGKRTGHFENVSSEMGGGVCVYRNWNSGLNILKKRRTPFISGTRKMKPKKEVFLYAIPKHLCDSISVKP